MLVGHSSASQYLYSSCTAVLLILEWRGGGCSQWYHWVMAMYTSDRLWSLPPCLWIVWVNQSNQSQGELAEFYTASHCPTVTPDLWVAFTITTLLWMGSLSYKNDKVKNLWNSLNKCIFVRPFIQSDIQIQCSTVRSAEVRLYQLNMLCLRESKILES